MRKDIAISRCVAIVDNERGPLSCLVPQLRELGFRSVRLPNASACAEYLRRFPKLCWLAINAPILKEWAPAIRALVQTNHPQLPLLWFEPDCDDMDSHDALTRVATVPTAAQIVQLINDALRSHFYDSELVNTLQVNSERALSSLGSFATLREPFLKASLVRLSELNGVLTFCGKGVAGHLLVSCDESGARSNAALGFGIPEAKVTQNHMSDMLGEVVNRILGALMPYFEAHGASVTFGLPVFIGATEAMLWSGVGAPALGLEFEGAFGAIFVELVLTEFTKGTGTGSLMPPPELLETGACLFL